MSAGRHRQEAEVSVTCTLYFVASRITWIFIGPFFLKVHLIGWNYIGGCIVSILGVNVYIYIMMMMMMMTTTTLMDLLHHLVCRIIDEVQLLNPPAWPRQSRSSSSSNGFIHLPHLVSTQITHSCVDYVYLCWELSRCFPKKEPTRLQLMSFHLFGRL